MTLAEVTYMKVSIVRCKCTDAFVVQAGAADAELRSGLCCLSMLMQQEWVILHCRMLVA